MQLTSGDVIHSNLRSGLKRACCQCWSWSMHAPCKALPFVFVITVVLCYPEKARSLVVHVHRQPSFFGAVGAPLQRQPGVTLRMATGEPATADLAGNVYVTASLMSISSSNPGSLPSELAPLPPIPENPILLGNIRVLAKCGIAQYTDLQIETVGTFKLSFSAPLLSNVFSNTTLSIGVMHGTARRLVILTQPRGVEIRVLFAVPPFLHIVDAAGNLVETGPDSELTIVASVASSKPLSLQPLVQTFPRNETQKAAHRGVVKMSNLMLDSEGNDIVLRFQAGTSNYSSSLSQPASIRPDVIEAFSAPLIASGPAYALEVMWATPPAVGARETFAPQPQVRIQSVNGTLYTHSAPGQSILVLASLDTSNASKSQQGESGSQDQGVQAARLIGDKATATHLGVATFTNLQVDVIGRGYRLVFAVSSPLAQLQAVRPARSQAFMVTVGSPVRLTIQQQAGGASPGLPVSVPPVVAVQDNGGNTVRERFLMAVELLQHATQLSPSGMQPSVVWGTLCYTADGVARFENLTLTLAGSGFSLRFRVLGSDGSTHPGIALAVSFPPFDILPGAAFALHVDRQPSGGLLWAPLAVSPKVSVRDRGGNRVEGGRASYVWAEAIWPWLPADTADMLAASVSTRNTPSLFNLSRPDLSPSGASSLGGARAWVDPNVSAVGGDAADGVSFEGLRVFSSVPMRGIVIRFRHCWKNDIELCAQADNQLLVVDTESFDLAGPPHHLIMLNATSDPLAAKGASSKAQTPLSHNISGYILTPDHWPNHRVLAAFDISLVDASGIVVKGLPLAVTAASPLSEDNGGANLRVDLCFLTDETAQEFYCRGEERDGLLYAGGRDSNGTEQAPCSMGPDVFLPRILGPVRSPLRLGHATVRNISVLSTGTYKFRFRLQAPWVAGAGARLMYVDSPSFTVVVGPVAKLVEVRPVGGFRPGYPALVQPVLAVTDAGDNVVVDACDAQGRDAIRVVLIYPHSGEHGHEERLTLALTPTASLRSCVAEFAGVQVDSARVGMRLNYSFVPYVKPASAEAYTVPTAEELAAQAVADARLARVRSLFTLSQVFTVSTGPLKLIREVQMPVGCLAGKPCDVAPVLALLDAGGVNPVQTLSGLLAVATPVSATGKLLSPSFEATPDASGRARFVGFSVADPGVVRVNYTLHNLPGFNVAGQELTVSTPASGLMLEIQPAGASPGLVMSQQPHLVLVDSRNLRVSSTSSEATGAIPAGDLAGGKGSDRVDVVEVEAVAFATRSAAGNSEVRQLPLAGTTRVLMERGMAKFTDLDFSFVGSCLQMKFIARRFSSPLEAAAHLGSASNLKSPEAFAALLLQPFSTASAKLDIVIGAPHHLLPYTQPADAIAGQVFAQQPKVAVLDAGANLIELDSGSAVTALLANGDQRLLLGGAGRIVASQQGLVRYSNLRLDLAGVCWVLIFKRPGVLPCNSRPLVVHPGKAQKLEILQQPASLAQPGLLLPKQPSVVFVDAYQNQVWDTTQQVTAVLVLAQLELPAAPGSSPFPAPYYGSSRGRGLIGQVKVGTDSAESQHAVCEAKASSCDDPKARSIVSYSDLRVDACDNSRGYALVFTSPGVASIRSAYFHVVAGSAIGLVLVAQPEGFRSGFRFKLQPLVALHDLGGNVIPLNISVQVELKPVISALGEATLRLTGSSHQFTTSLAGSHDLEPAAPRPPALLRGADGGTGVAAYTDLGLTDYTSSTASGLVLDFTPKCKDGLSCPYVGVRSRVFTSGGVPSALALLTPLSTCVAGAEMQVQPKILVQDGSRITAEFWDGEGSDYAVATVELSQNVVGLDSRQAKLLGNSSAIYRLGVAQWTDLRIEVASQVAATPFSPPPASYFLTFKLRGQEWTEGGLVVSHALPDHYVIWVQPASSLAGQTSSAPGPVIALTDRYGNRAESISVGLVNAILLNDSALAFSRFPGPFEAVGSTQAPLVRGIANFSRSPGLGSKIAAMNLRFNFSGRGVAAEPGVTEGWNFPSSSGSVLLAPLPGALEMRWIMSEPFTVTHGPVIALRVMQAPQVFVASSALSPQPIVLLLDAGSNAVQLASWQTISIKIVRSDGTETELGSQVAVQGVVAFSNVGLPSSPTAAARLKYLCTQCESGHAPLILLSAAFDVAAFSGGASVVISTPASSEVYGGLVFAQQPVLAIQDSGGRLVTADQSTVVRASLVTLKPQETLWELPPTTMLVGTTEVVAANGLASFTDLAITSCNDPLDRACTKFAQVRLRFATRRLSPTCAPFPEQYPPVPPPCLPADSAPLAIKVGAASALVVWQQPSSDKAGAAFTSSPIICLADAGGNLLDRRPSGLDSIAVDVWLVDANTGRHVQQSSSEDPLFVGASRVRSSALPTGPAALDPATFPQIRFVFTDLGVRKAKAGYRLYFNATYEGTTGTSLASVESSVFTIAVGTLQALAIQARPGNGFGGSVLSQQPSVHVIDAGANLVSSTPAWMAVTAVALPGGNEKPPRVAAGGEVPVKNGIAVFERLALAEEGACVQLQFKSCLPNNIFDCPYLSEPSLPMTVRTGLASRLSVLNQPSPVQQAGVALKDITVVIQDAGGNRVGTATESIVASIECRTSVAISAYTVTISPICAFTTDYIDHTGALLPPHTFPPPSSPVLPALLGKRLLVSEKGVLRFTDLAVSRAGGPYRLSFARVAGFLQQAVTETFVIAPGRVERLHIQQQPGTSEVSGYRILVPQPRVMLLDSAGNLVTDSQQARHVHVALLQHGYPVYDANCEPRQQARCRPLPSLQAPPVATTSGVAAFTSLALNRAGEGYTLVFCDGPCRARKQIYNISAAALDVATLSPSGLPAARWVQTWPPLRIKTGVPYKAFLWQELGDCIARLPCMQQPVVLIQDRAGNTLTDLADTSVAASVYNQPTSTRPSSFSLVTAASSAAAALDSTASSSSSTPSSSSSASSSAPQGLTSLLATATRGRATFSGIGVNFPTTAPQTLSVQYAVSIYNLAVQVGLQVSSVPAGLSWEREPPAASDAGIAWALPLQPVVLVIDQAGRRVFADSSSEIQVEVLASESTLAAGHVQGRGPRKPSDLLLGNTRSQCCRGRCVFTDLSLGLAGSAGFQLKASTQFRALAPAQAAIYGPLPGPVSTMSQPIVVSGCYAPLTCNARGTCAADTNDKISVATPSPNVLETTSIPSATPSPGASVVSNSSSRVWSRGEHEHEQGVRANPHGEEEEAVGGGRSPRRQQVKIGVLDVPPDPTGGYCTCLRGFYGRACERSASMRKSATVSISSANIGQTTELSLGGGEGLLLPPGFVAPESLPLDISADLINELTLPADMLPRPSDPFVPAGSFADFRPDGLRFRVPVEIALSYHTAESGSKRLFIFTFNHSIQTWERHSAHGSVVDQGARLVRSKLDHFSMYAVMLEDMGFTPAPTPAPARPLASPAPANNILGIVYIVAGVLFPVLMAAAAVWQICRFRENRRLHAVTLELADKHRKEVEGEDEGSDLMWWHELSHGGDDEENERKEEEKRRRREAKKIRRKARLQGTKSVQQHEGMEEMEDTEARKQRRRIRKQHKVDAAKRREQLHKAKAGSFRLPNAASEGSDSTDLQAQEQSAPPATPPPAGPRIIALSLLQESRDAAAASALRDLGWQPK